VVVSVVGDFVDFGKLRQTAEKLVLESVLSKTVQDPNFLRKYNF